MKQITWNRQLRVEHWLRATVGRVLGPIFRFCYFVFVGISSLVLLGCVALVSLISMFYPGGQKKVVILRSGELQGDPNILEVESGGPANESIHRDRLTLRPSASKSKSKGRLSFRVLPPPEKKGLSALLEKAIKLWAKSLGLSSSSSGKQIQPCKKTLLSTFKKDLARCATANGVFALVEECFEGVWSGVWIENDFIEVTLERLMEVGADREEIKKTLALFGLLWVLESPVDERVVKLRCDHATGEICWNDTAVLSVYFEKRVGNIMSRILAQRAALRLSVLFNADDQLVFWRFWIYVK